MSQAVIGASPANRDELPLLLGGNISGVPQCRPSARLRRPVTACTITGYVLLGLPALPGCCPGTPVRLGARTHLRYLVLGNQADDVGVELHFGLLEMGPLARSAPLRLAVRWPVPNRQRSLFRQ